MRRRRRPVLQVHDTSMFTHVYYHHPKRYGFFAFMVDILMTGLTGGLWLIWIFVREMRRPRRTRPWYD